MCPDVLEPGDKGRGRSSRDPSRRQVTSGAGRALRSDPPEEWIDIYNFAETYVRRILDANRYREFHKQKPSENFAIEKEKFLQMLDVFLGFDQESQYPELRLEKMWTCPFDEKEALYVQPDELKRLFKEVINLALENTGSAAATISCIDGAIDFVTKIPTHYLLNTGYVFERPKDVAAVRDELSRSFDRGLPRGHSQGLNA